MISEHWKIPLPRAVVTGICVGTVLTTLVLAAPKAWADGDSLAPLARHTLYGISAETGNLFSYNFDKQAGQTIGPVKMVGSDAALTGIEATAYTPTHMNLYGFWKNPHSGLVRLIYINTKNAQAAVVGQDIGDGTVTGAVAAMAQPDTSLTDSQATPPADVQAYQLYAVQLTGPSVRRHQEDDGWENDCDHEPISGEVNINPDNSAASEFDLTKPDGSTINRDDLKDAEVDDHGVEYHGACSSVVFKPKGNGDRNTLLIGGVSYDLRNNTTYRISGSDLNCTVYNDHVENGKAMGHWYLKIDGDDLRLDKDDGNNMHRDKGDDNNMHRGKDDDSNMHRDKDDDNNMHRDKDDNNDNNPTPPNLYPARLLRIDPATGKYTVIQQLAHPYVSLAATSANNFYATVGSRVYAINVSADTETLVGDTGITDLQGLECAGPSLYGFSTSLNALLELNTTTAAPINDPINLGVSDLHTITFMRNPDSPTTATYD